MKVEMRRLITETLPPLTLPRTAPCRIRPSNPMPRLRRIACLLAALALPALGITVADTVHRVGEAKATQAAVPVSASDGAAAPRGAVPAMPNGKTAALRVLRREVRS